MAGLLLLLALGAIAFVLAVIVWFVKLIATHLLEIAIVCAVIGGAVAIGYLIHVAVHRVRRARTGVYLELCRKFCEQGSLPSEEMAKLDGLGEKIPLSLPARVIGEEAIYRDFVAQILADGKIDDDERRVLQELEIRFAFEPQSAWAIKESAFEGLLTAFQSQLEFDEVYERCLREVAEGLGLQANVVEGHLRVLHDRQARAAAQAAARAAAEAERARREAQEQAEREREYQLAADVWDAESRDAASPAVKLARTETPWYVTPAVEVKRFKKGDKRREGELLVTDRRLLFVTDGTTTVRLNQILDVAADVDEGNLRVIKDGRKRPIDFEVPHPLEALAHVERSLAELSA